MDITKKVEAQVKKTLQKAKISKNKKILVAMSGGKDSASVAYLLDRLGYKIEGFHIDLKIGDYSDRCRKAVEKLCSQLGIKLHVYDTKKKLGAGMCYIRTAVQNKQDKTSDGKNKIKLKNCAICGVIKKWIFNKESRRIGADYIATGHNLDDECQTFLMNIFKGSPKLSANTGVITRNTGNKKFVSRIKPLFYVAEGDVREYTRKLKLPVVYDKCPCALDSYRIQVRQFMNMLSEKEKLNIMNNFEKIYPLIEKKKDTRMQYCEVCGEPARNKVCKKCELLNVK
jgi:uncharacterized protein (TIGR00269 family)